MADNDFEAQIEQLEKLAQDDKAQRELGRRLVAEVAEAVMAERKGAEIDRPDVEMAIRKGDIVPPSLADRVAVDKEGRALHDATVQTQNLIIWLRIWVRFWLRIIWGFDINQSPLQRFEDFAERVRFTGDEQAMFDRLRRLAR